jgi:hypothetical protein
VPTEDTDPTIVATGQALREQLLAANERKHAATGYRVLMFRPGSITAEIWFDGLARCMRHAGIECRVLEPQTPAGEINAAIESFQPNVFIATEATESLHALDLPFLLQYKRRHGCLRLLIPVWYSNTRGATLPPGMHSTPELDEWRRGLRRDGLSADAHFNIFEPEFQARFAPDPGGPAVEYAVIPQACNPFFDYPVPAAKCHDYCMASSMTDDRVAVSYRYLRPILRRYQGLWVGPFWGFGTRYVAPAEMPLQYAQSRIALSPLVPFVQLYGAELTHRVYAAAACGAFQLTSWTSITGRYFQPDELVQARTPDEFARLFDHYVDRPQERNAIALAALRRAYREHTCFHRVDKLVSHWDEWRHRGLF